MPHLFTALSPALFAPETVPQPFAMVVVDIFRATTCFCTALHHGAAAIIPVNDLVQLQRMQQQGYLTAAEREGEKLPFAHFGNDPNVYRTADIAGKEIAYSTTNGTVAIEKAVKSGSAIVAVASFLNLTAIAEFFAQQPYHLVILCSGWHQQCSFEDTFFAGALCEKLLQHPHWSTTDDATHMALTLWENGRQNPQKSIEENSAHLQRLLGFGITNTLPYALMADVCPTVVVWKEGRLVAEQ